MPEKMYESALGKTRRSWLGRLAGFWSSSQLTEEQWEELEATLIQADVGLSVATSVIDQLRSANIRDEAIAHDELRKVLLSLLRDPVTPNLSGRPLSVILIVGVNGSGKTTTIAKLAYRFVRLQKRRVLLAAADTFRAAAIEQLQLWGKRVGAPVIAQQPGADPAAVVYDAGEAARAGNYDLLIIDTAGRLHTNANLMAQLAKLRKVTTRIATDAPHETWLILDGTTGQNAIQQARQFQEQLMISGVIVSKLDSSARGGMIFSVCQDLQLPVQYIGLGERIEDLVLFSPNAFVDSLLSTS